MEALNAFLAAATWGPGASPCDESTALTCGFEQRPRTSDLKDFRRAARLEWKVRSHSRCRYCLQWV